MNRSTIYVIIGVAVIIIIAIFAVWFFTKSPSSPANTAINNTGSLPGSSQGGQTTGGNLPATGVAEGGNGSSSFGLVSNEQVFSYFVDPQNDVEAIEPSGEIAEIENGADGQANFLSSSQLQNLITGGFSYDGMFGLVNFGNVSNPQTSVFNMKTKTWNALPVNMISPAWSPVDYRIAYLSPNSDGSVTLATLDGSKAASKPVALLTLNAQDLMLSWPSKNLIVLSDRPTAYNQGEIWFYNLSTKSLTLGTAAAYGLSATWSNTANPAGIVWGSNTSDGTGGLTLQGIFGTSTAMSTQGFNFLTLPSKCTFNTELQATTTASSTPSAAPSATPTPLKGSPKQTPAPAPQTYLALYCAIPQNQSSFGAATMPDQYDQMAFFTADNFYRIHTDTGATDAVLLPSGSYDATDLHVYNSILFFVNRYDQKLYAISL
jgi:hypothetical protein